MKYSFNKLHTVFIVNDKNVLEVLSRHIKRIGFRIKDTSSKDETVESVYNPLRFVRLPRTKVKGNSYNELVHILNTLSPNTTSVIIALQDLSSVKIFQNRRRQSLDNHPTLSEVEKEHIIATLEESGWQRKKSAKLLGIDRSTLYRKMKKYGIIKKSVFRS